VPELCTAAEWELGRTVGTHDDRIMAMAIGLAARAELAGKNAASSD